MVRLMAKSLDEINPIREFFKTENPSKFYIEYNRPGAVVDDYIYGISSIGFFKIGLLLSVVKILKKYNVPVSIDKKILQELFPIKYGDLKVKEFDIPFHEQFQSRDYQSDAVNALLKHGRGIILLPTASGKSFVVAKTLWSLLKSEPDKIKHCLILVPNTNLVKQFYGDLLDYGIPESDISMFSSKKKTCENTKIIISNRQWLERHKDELPNIDVLFVDECHGLTLNNKVSRMVSEFDTNLKFGCTATLPNAIENRWELMGLIGPILYQQSVINMQENNFISDFCITSIHVFDRKIDRDKSCLFSLNRKVSSKDIAEPYEFERKYITDHMIELYKQPIQHIVDMTDDTNTLFLFDFIPFGKSLFEYMSSIIPEKCEIYYIDGSIDVDIRTDIQKKVEDGVNIFIVAQSTCFNTGINIKNLHNIGFVFNSKSSSKVVQSIGRILRKHKSKTHVNLYDINFNFKYSKRHFSERTKIYKEVYNKSVSAVIKFLVN
jgi:superfamily II DNA or RNA helicase